MVDDVHCTVLVYSPVSCVPRIRIHGPVNAETVCFWRIVIVVAECQSSPLAWWRCIWERHACISIGSRIVVYRCADARGGGIGSTRGSPSESGTFHCRTRGGRIAIVLSLSIQLLLIRSWKTFSSFPAEGNFFGSVHRARNLVHCPGCANSYLKCVVFANYWNGVNPPRPMTQFTESRLY